MRIPAEIMRLVEHPDQNRARREIEAIFFETSNTKEFESEAARAAFLDRWLGRYMKHYADQAFLALGEGSVVGYLVGCLDDPSMDSLFSDISYYAAFADLTAEYPAHLHINVTAKYRSHGIGAHLIEAFASHAAHSNASGMHVVTGAGARNNRFYLACGFQQLREADWNGNRIAFFGRSLVG